jgi:hypothetical protein
MNDPAVVSVPARELAALKRRCRILLFVVLGNLLAWVFSKEGAPK